MDDYGCVVFDVQMGGGQLINWLNQQSINHTSIQ
jgi:hypothetical protein